MIDVTVDASDYHRAWTAEMRNLERGAEMCVEVAGKAGETAARLTAPFRTGELRDKIRFRPESSGARGARGIFESLARHSSWMNDGTPPHAIEARRKKVLRFVGAGGETFRRRVQHPGTAPTRFFSDAVEVVEIRLVRAGENVANALATRMSR